MARNIIYSLIIVFYFVATGQGAPISKRPSTVDVDFDNAPLSEVVFTIAEITGAGYVWPSLPELTVNWSEKNIQRPHLMNSFNDVLSAYGLTCVPIERRRNFFVIQQISRRTSGAHDGSSGVYFLKHINADSFEESIAALYDSRLSYALMRDNNAVYFSGAPKIVRGFTAMLEQIDRPAQNLRALTVKLAHVPVKDAYTSVQQLAENTKVLPNYWNRSIILRGPVQEVADIESALKTIDQPRQGNVRQIAFISSLTSDQAVPALTGLYENLTVQAVTPRKLLLSGPAEQVTQALELLGRLDGSDYQVRVETIIANLTDSEFHELGVKISDQDDDSFQFSLNDHLDSLIVNNTGLLVDYFSDLIGLRLKAQDGVSHGEILSSPVLTVLNGQTARLHVGQNVPFLSQKKLISDDSEESEALEIKRHDVGVKFAITPAIDPAGEFIHLTVNQEVSSVQEEQTAAAADLITDKKELSTTVVVADGDTIFLGGMKSEETSTTTNRVPLLGSIPLVGGLFTYKSDKQVTRHLVIGLKVNVIKKS
jgi:general secretion pathway protein D